MARSQTVQRNVNWLARVKRGISRWVTQVLYPEHGSPAAGSHSRSRKASVSRVLNESEKIVPRVKPEGFTSAVHESRAEEGAECARPAAESESADLTFDQLQSYLQAKGVRFSAREHQYVLDTGFRLPMGDFPAYVHIQAESSLVVVYVHIPIVVPEDKRASAAETIVRANYGLAIGRFELGMRDGILGFRAAMPFTEGGVTDKQFDDLLMVALGSAAKYHRAFARLVYADDLSPAEVIAEVEMGD